MTTKNTTTQVEQHQQAADEDERYAQAANFVQAVTERLENPFTPDDLGKAIADEAADLLSDSGDLATQMRVSDEQIVAALEKQ